MTIFTGLDQPESGLGGMLRPGIWSDGAFEPGTVVKG